VNVDGIATERGWPNRWIHRGFAFARSAEPRARISRRAVAADVVLAVIVTAGSVVTALLAVRSHGASEGVVPRLVFFQYGGRVFPHPLAPLPAHSLRALSQSRQIGQGVTGASSRIPWQAAIFAVVTAAPLAARRLLPLATFWVALCAIITANQYSTAITFFAVVFAAYCAVVHSRFRGPALVSLPVAAVMVTAAFPDISPPIPARFTAFAVLLPVMIVGNAMHLWRRRADDSQARLGRLQAEHEAATRHALELERARIASELHDVVTHNVSVMVVQAGAARQVLADSPGEAREALLAVEATGRAAMTELRHLLGLLCPSGEPAGGTADAAADAAGATATQPLRPQPGLGQLRTLIDRVAAAGLPIELHITGTPCGLPPGLDLAAYRVIQEALTNVIKHAGKARTEVRLGYHPDELVVEIADDGRPIPAAVPSAVAAGAEHTIPGNGRGLLGLRTRIALYDGVVDAGRRPGGGWLLRAAIPVDALPAVTPVNTAAAAAAAPADEDAEKLAGMSLA